MYTPILRWKMGERFALKHLDPAIKQHVRPLIVLDPEKATVEFPDDVGRDWGTSELLLDVARVHEEKEAPPSGTWLDWYASELSKRSLRMVPIIAPQNAPEFLDAAASVCRIYGRGAALRVGRDDLFGEDGKFAFSAHTVMRATGLEPRDIDLVLDLGAISADDVGALRAAVTAVWSSIGAFGTWRSIVVVSGAFPSDMKDVPPGVSRLLRHDRVLANQLASVGAFRYGDYTAMHPVHGDFDPRTMTPAAKVVYALASEWVIARGISVKRHPKGWGQAVELCQLLIDELDQSFERTAEPSWADLIIRRVAAGQGKTGTARQWVSVRVNRHITATVQQMLGIAPSTRF